MLMRIKLTDEEKQQLLKIKQKGESETIRDRAHAVLLRNKGFTIENIAKALLRSDKFVKSALRLFKGKKLAKTNFKGNNHKLSSEQRAETIKMIREKAPNELKEPSIEAKRKGESQNFYGALNMKEDWQMLDNDGGPAKQPNNHQIFKETA